MTIWYSLYLVFVLLLPFSFTLNPTSNIDLPIIRILIPLLFLAWLGQGFLKRRLIFDIRIRFLLLIAFLFFSSVSLLWALEPSFGARKALYLISFFPLYLVSFAASQKKEARKKVIMIICWSGFLVSVWALLQFLLQFILGIDATLAIIKAYIPFFLGNSFSALVFAYPSWLVNISGKTLIRAFAIFPDPHLFSLFVNMIIPLSLYYFSKSKKQIYILIALVMFFASISSFSRASYLAIISASIFFLTTSFGRKVIAKKFSILFLVLLSFVLLLLLPNPFSNRFFASFELTEGSNSGRIEMWNTALHIIEEKPLSGVGLGNFSYYVDPAINMRNPVYAHNILLDFGSELGIIPALLLLALLLSPIIKFYTKPSPQSLAIATSFVIFFVQSMFENPFFSVRVFSIFIIMLSYKTDG